jgi:hypothetical protein
MIQLVNPLTPLEQQELFSYMRLNRAVNEGRATRDELNKRLQSLSEPVFNTVMRNSKITFEVI